MLGFREGVEFAAGEGFTGEVFGGREDADLATDGFSGLFVVAGDDDDADSGFTTFCDGGADFGAGRVEHADEANEGHVLFELGIFVGCGGALVEWVLGNVFNSCEGDDAETSGRVVGDFGFDDGAGLVAEGNLGAVGANKGGSAASEDGFRSAFDEEDGESGRAASENGHGLAVAGEFVGILAGKAGFIVFVALIHTLFAGLSGGINDSFRSSELFNENLEGAFGGLANVGERLGLGVIRKGSIVTNSAHLGELADNGRAGGLGDEAAGGSADFSDRRKAGSLDEELVQFSLIFANSNSVGNAHLVGSQSSRLVGADNTAASESLDGRKTADYSAMSSHLAGSESEAGGDDNSEAFRNSSNTERDSDLRS